MDGTQHKSSTSSYLPVTDHHSGDWTSDYSETIDAMGSQDSIDKSADTSAVQPVISVKEGHLDDVNAIDEAILAAQGHKQAMPRNFSMISALGLGFRCVFYDSSSTGTCHIAKEDSITNSWVGYLSCFGQNLAYGGPQSVILGLLVATFAQGTITLGLSELASAFPSSGV